MDLFIKNLSSQQILSLDVFIFGVTALFLINFAFALIFIIGAIRDPKSSVQEAGITFVSGHFLAFFILPLAIIVAAALGINGKLDSGVSAIIGAAVTYIVQKVTVR